MKKTLLTLAILSISVSVSAKGFDFDGYRKQKYTLPPLPHMMPFQDYSGFLWEVSLNENGEFVVSISGVKYTLAKADTYAMQKFLNDNLPDAPNNLKTNQARVLKWHQKTGGKVIVVDEKFFRKGNK